MRISALGDVEPDGSADADDLSRIIDVAARLGDARGDDGQARKTLESGLRRFGPSASPAVLARAHLYLAELALRTGDPAAARVARDAADAAPLTADERAALADEFAHVAEITAP